MLKGDQVASGLGMKLPSRPSESRMIRPYALIRFMARRSSFRSQRSICPPQVRQPSGSVLDRKSTVTSISPHGETIVAGPV